MTNRHRRSLAAILSAVLLFPTGSWASSSGSRKHPRSKASHGSVRRTPPAEEPGAALPSSRLYGGALLFDAEDGSILFARSIYTEFPPASLTKLMLALVVVEDLRAGRATLEQPIPVSATAMMTPSSGVYLRKDEVLTLDEMMTAALVHSANNACVAVAEALDGSEAAFVERMNGWARSLGMRQTVFRSANGLPQPPGMPSDTTTAFDMAVLARKAVQYPEILRWTSRPIAPFRNGKVQLRSTNRLLSQISGLDGLKTGFTLSAGFHLIATGVRDGVRVISVVLGSETSARRFQASEKLVRLGFATLGRSVQGENLPSTLLPDPETVALLSVQTTSHPRSAPSLPLSALAPGWTRQIRVPLPAPDEEYGTARTGL